jgi:hypothetical protein
LAVAILAQIHAPAPKPTAKELPTPSIR